MKTISSFTVDHRELPKGLYVSRVDGDITTWDLRMAEPNVDTPLTPAAAHTLEHILATYLRNSEATDSIVYVGPMGCLTGFYVLTRDVETEPVIALLVKAFNYIADFDGDIPGATAEQCGNYSLQDLSGARTVAKCYAEVLRDWTASKTAYPKML